MLFSWKGERNNNGNVFSVNSLAAQREQYIKDKEEQKDMYKRALSAQVRITHIANFETKNIQILASVAQKPSFAFTFHENQIF